MTLVIVRVALVVFLAMCVVSLISAKIFDRCQFVKQLTHLHQVPRYQIPTWTCIAYKVSRFDTNAVKQNRDGSTGYGIFQISDGRWCNGLCKYSCNELKSDDISKSVACALTVWKKFKETHKSGFEAWPAYKYCNTIEKVKPYVDGCLLYSKDSKFIGVVK